MENIHFIRIKNESFVSIPELNEVLDSCAGLTGVSCAVRMINPVKRIDIAFIGGLYLLYVEQSIRFNVTGCGDRGDLFSSPTYKDELGQFLSQLNIYSSRDPYWIRIAEIPTPEAVSHKTGLFAPVLLIDKLSLDLLFRENVNSVYLKLSDLYINGLEKKTNKLEIDFFSETANNQLIVWLKANPPIYSFVYCLLHRIGRPFVDKNSMQEVQERIYALQSFTEHYVAGLYELAKNIVWHSSSGTGVITIGSYREDDQEKRLIKTYVLDYGTRGIIPTMIMELNPDLQEDVEDRRVLENGYDLKHFFKPDQSHRLLRQIRREMAHLGLIHFISMIRTNEGRCSISTYGVDGERDFFGDGSIDDLPNRGTSFYFELPLAKDIEYKGTNEIISDMRATMDSLSAMPQIFNVEDSIKIFSLRPLDVCSREDEQVLVNSVPLKDVECQYCAVDFINVTITATSLLRVLAMISESTDRSVIIFNLATEVLSDMIMSNDTYFRQLKDIDIIPYWIKDRSILAYSHFKDTIFYFADILYGDNTQAFRSINQIVNNTFPNYTTIACDNVEVPLTDNSADLPVSHFFQKSTLLPFDIVLKREGNPLFYSNLLFLTSKSLMK